MNIPKAIFVTPKNCFYFMPLLGEEADSVSVLEREHVVIGKKANMNAIMSKFEDLSWRGFK